MLYLIEHDGDLTHLGPSWLVYEKAMPAKSRAVYNRLRESEYAEAKMPLSDLLLAKQCGLSSKSAFYSALEELQETKFVDCFLDEGITYVRILAPPPLREIDEKLLDTIGAEMLVSERAAANRLSKAWKEGWEKSFHEEYEIKTKDFKAGLRLVKGGADLKGTLALITWYWRYAHEGDHKSFAAFCSEYNFYSSEKSNFEENLI